VSDNIQFKLQESFRKSAQLVLSFGENEQNLSKLSSIAHGISETFKTGKKILICGNGGSACDAMHFAEEFTGRYRQDRRALPVIALTDPGHLTCVANDYGFEEVFARGVEAFGQKGDWLIGLSTSGNSQNVYRAFKKAEELELHTFSLLGKDGGLIKGICDEELIIPGHTADRIQEVHMTILHILIEGVERILFPKNYSESHIPEKEGLSV
jgi:D-sedoheptulose 7-phosphate isomerase